MDVRISVLVLDGIVNDVAMILDTRDNSSDSSRWFCDIDSLKNLAGETLKRDASSLKVVVINWLADDLRLIVQS